MTDALRQRTRNDFLDQMKFTTNNGLDFLIMKFKAGQMACVNAPCARPSAKLQIAPNIGVGADGAAFGLALPLCSECARGWDGRDPAADELADAGNDLIDPEWADAAG